MEILNQNVEDKKECNSNHNPL